VLARLVAASLGKLKELFFSCDLRWFQFFPSKPILLIFKDEFTSKGAIVWEAGLFFYTWFGESLLFGFL